MKRRAFAIFLATVSALVALILWFIQTPQFASNVKNTVLKHIPADLGIEGDFSEFTIKLFPPGISIRNPKVSLRSKNALNLPEGTSISSERLDLIFRPLQMFSGKIQVHEVIIANGDLMLRIDPKAPEKAPKPQSKNKDFLWDDLLQIRSDALIVENTNVRLEAVDHSFSMLFNATRLRIAQWNESGPGYALSMELRNVTGQFPAHISLPQTINAIRGEARINATGLWMDSLRIDSSGFSLTTEGAVKGNLLAPKSLPVDAKIKLTADAQRLAEFYSANPKKPVPASGLFDFEGKVKGDLLKLKDGFHADGDFKIQKAKYKDWYADTLEAKASWISSPSGGDLQVSKAVLTSTPKLRAGGEPGAGGRIEIGSFKINLGHPQPFTVPLQLEQAHIHWLGAGVIADVYNMDFKVRGGVEVTFFPKTSSSPWALQASTDLAVDDFQLDNQRYKKVRPLNRILKIPSLNIDGTVKIDPAGIHFGGTEGVKLALPQTQLKITGDIDSTQGYNFRASGPVQLEDIRELGGNTIKGSGTLNAHIHGPASRVILDFDADLKDAYYLRLRLGHLKGRISYDEAPSQLIFSKVNVQKGTTQYIGNGTIDFGTPEKVNLNFDVPTGNIQDMIQIFHEQLSDIWWFPSSLTGPIQGDIQVTGGLEMKNLKALGKLTGSSWEYLGERFRNVQMSGGYDRGGYVISDFKTVKRTGKLSGKISYSADEQLDWLLRSDDFTVLDIDHFAQLDVPMRGKLSIFSSGKGFLGSILSENRFSLVDYSVRGTTLPPSFLNLRSENGQIRCNGIALGGQGSLDFLYDFKPNAPSYIKSELKHFDFSPFLLLLNPRLAQDTSLTSTVSGSINMNFKSGTADRGTGRITLTDYLLAKKNARFELENPIDLKVEEGSFQLNDLRLKSPSGILSANLTSKNTRLEGAIQGPIHLSMIEFLTSTVSQTDGNVDIDLSLGGIIKEPTVFGNARISKASLWVPAVESPFENISAVFQLRQNVLAIQTLESDLATGHVSAQGSVEVFPNKYPTVSIKGSINGSKLKVFPFQFVKVRGNVHVHGAELPYLIEGTVTADSALSKEKVFNQRQSEGLKAAEYMPLPTKQSDTNYPKFRLNIDARADKGILIQNDLFDAEAKGHVTIVNTLETPRILGEAELIQGKINFKGHVFQIQSASATFDSPTVINPSFAMTAQTDVNNTKIQMYANGRMDKFKVELTSNPAMPESEILSLLAMGIPPSEVKKLNPSDRSVVEQGEAASLLLHSLDFNREVQSKTGLQIQLSESVDPSTSQSITRPPSLNEAGAAPKIVIKKQIGSKLDLSLGSTVGIGTNTRQEVNAEYRVTPGFSVIGVYDNYETLDAQEKKSYGMDLKFQRRFGK